MKTETSQTYTSEFRQSSFKLALESDQSIKKTAERLAEIPRDISSLSRIVSNDFPRFC